MVKVKKYNFIGFVFLILVGAIWIIFASRAHAFVVQTGGDGYLPVIFQGKIFNIFHHQRTSNSLSPKPEIDCFEQNGGALCPGYPHYFSSDVGSSGKVGVGTPGTPDIFTTYFPHLSTLFGSRVFYAAQRSNDNGIGCFDLNNNTNCGYFQLGTIHWSGLQAEPEEVEGVVQVDTKLYSVGNDMRMYCLDVANPLAPTVCAGQPYSFNAGIETQLPAYNGNRFEDPINNAAGPDQNKIFIVSNYRTSNPEGLAHITCFDTNTKQRCTGWASQTLDFSDFAHTYSRSVFKIFDPSGNFVSICAATVIAHPPQCFNQQTMAAVPPPPNFLNGVTSRDPLGTTYVWDHVDSNHNTIYLALSGGGPGRFGEAYCYDFTIQNHCVGFGTNGVKAWDGLDGGIAVNGGATKDYAYAIDGLCMYGLGDPGILWTFRADTGQVAAGNLTCNANGVLGASFSAPASGVLGETFPKLPNTGTGPIEKINKTLSLLGVVGLTSGILILNVLKKRKNKNFKTSARSIIQRQ